MDTKIKLLSTYNERMSAGMADKLFFVDKVDADIYFDFGCADGALLRQLKEICPDKIYYGYDNNAAMIDTALSHGSNILYLKTLQAASYWLKTEEGKKALILSSVIHEIYAYDDPEKIWEWIWAQEFDYIIIRDMSISNKSLITYMDGRDVTKITEKSSAKHIREFRYQYRRFDDGYLDLERNFAHWLLKYHYIDGWDQEIKYQRSDNWDRELREDYFGLYYEDLLNLVPDSYNVIYNEHYTLPYIKEKVKKDLDIEFNTKTHVKLILKREK